MKTTDAKLETLDKDLAYIAGTVNNLATTDHETVDTLLRLIREMRADVEGIRLELAPEEDAEPLAA